MENKKTTTTFVAIGRAVLLLQQNPSKYNGKTMREQAEIFSEEIGLPVSESSVNAIFEAAGITRVGAHPKPMATRRKTGVRLRMLARAMRRQIEAINAELGTSIVVDQAIIDACEDKASQQFNFIDENSEA